VKHLFPKLNPASRKSSLRELMDEQNPTTQDTGAAHTESTVGREDTEAFRAALHRIVDSEVFAGSRRMSAFLLFAGHAALDGRVEIDQYEIAEQVLNRHEDFNPLDDASVRKLASQVRSKLEEYFDGEGAAEPIVISLPRRSYIPRFRYRDAAPAAPPGGGAEMPALNPELRRHLIEAVPEASVPEPSIEPPDGVRARWRFAAGMTVAALAVLGAGAWLGAWISQSPSLPEIKDSHSVVIQTKRGDVRGELWDVAKDAVRIGPELASGQEATVELTFTPERATQQAGVMAFGSPDHFVRFGQHFKDRAMIEQSFEIDARSNLAQSHFLADPLGQFGRSRWFSLRREGSRYEAFLSSDGLHWSSFAPPMEISGLPAIQRAALYAYNGRSDGPSATAAFRDFRVGLAFHNRPNGPLRAEDFPGWTERADCANDSMSRIEGGVLQVGFSPAEVGCNWYFTQAPPEGDWSYATMLDFVPVSGSVAGLVIRGDKGNTYLSRRHFHSNILSLERTNDEDQRVPDFPGAPPVILRIEARSGILSASASRDGRSYIPVAGGVRLEDLGPNLRIGVFSNIAHWTSEALRPPARFHWIQRLVQNPESLSEADRARLVTTPQASPAGR
jgi:hypothetical protein